jgi:hypothetical protein
VVHFLNKGGRRGRIPWEDLHGEERRREEEEGGGTTFGGRRRRVKE